MNFLIETPDFITKSVGDNPSYYPNLFTFFGITAVLSFVLLVVSMKLNWLTIAFVSAVLFF